MRNKKMIIGTLALSLLATPLVATVDATNHPAQASQQDIVGGDYTKNAQIILDEINKYRTSRGLKPVKYSPTITKIAQQESDRAVRDENYWHSGNFLRDGRAGRWNSAGEVTALEYSVNPKALVDWWKTSPKHNAFLLNPNIHVIGIGVTFADGHLTNTGQPWRILSTVDGFGYSGNNAPSDARTTVTAPKTTMATAIPQSKYTLRGAIGNYYKNHVNIGTPIMNERTGLVEGGAYQEFMKNGKKTTIYWSPATNAHSIDWSSPIAQRFAKNDFERGFGHPSTDMGKTKDGSYWQSFKSTRKNSEITLLYTPGRGTFIINEKGAIGHSWNNTDRERGWGYPISDEYRGNDGKIHQKFSKGVEVTWTSHEGTRRIR